MLLVRDRDIRENLRFRLFHGFGELLLSGDCFGFFWCCRLPSTGSSSLGQKIRFECFVSHKPLAGEDKSLDSTIPRPFTHEKTRLNPGMGTTYAPPQAGTHRSPSRTYPSKQAQGSKGRLPAAPSTQPVAYHLTNVSQAVSEAS